MKWTQLLSITLRQIGKDTEMISHELLLRAGYIRQLSAGIYSLMHFGQRSRLKIEQILREEMDRIGGVEISMPVVHPAEIWEKTGRYDAIDDSMVRFKDRNGRRLVLGMTHEEVVADIVQHEISSYKQLPKLVYQIQTKFRDEMRPRGGLVRVKEFIMKDSYSLDKDWEGLEQQYWAHYGAYFRIFSRAGVPVISVLSDVGMMGGKIAHEYMYLNETGEDSLFICDNCDYKANKEVAKFKKQYDQPEPLPLEKVHTPGTKTIADLAEFLGIEAKQTGKVVFFSITNEEDVMEKLVIAVIRGDLEVNENKVKNFLKAEHIRPATEDEIRLVGAEPGYASPIGIDREKSIVLVDETVASSHNLVVGANKLDYHLKNACHGRDFESDFIIDIASAYDGATCADCGGNGKLAVVRGIEVGNIFQLGTKYSKSLNAMFADEDDQLKPVIMGSYGIGVGRLLACAVEEHHDKDGLCLPISIAPYQVLIVQLGNADKVVEAANKIYKKCKAAGIEILHDDRNIKSAGIKFKDADLIGIPIRITVSNRSLKNGGVELKLRREQDREMVALDNLVGVLQDKIKGLFEELALSV